MRVFISLLSVLLIALPASAAKKVKVHRGYYSGITFLKFKQVAKLPRNAQIKYIRTLRQMFLDIEKTQEDFHKASNAWTPQQKKDFYALLFGKDLHAAEDTHERGAQCADRCIYAYNLKHYVRNKAGECKGFPFGCSKPATCKMGGSTLGYTCGESISGLTGRDACVRQDLNRGVTALCEQKRASLANGFVNARGYNLEKLMADVDKAFGFDKGTVSKDYLKSKEAAAFIEKLIATRFNDHSYATLITLMELYKKNGIAFPTDNQNVLDLQKNFDGFIAVVDGIFGDYMEMCDTPLGTKVINDIRDLKNATPGSFNNSLEKARKELLEEAERKGETITSRNVLQKPQCIRVTARRNALIRATEELGRQLPKARDMAPPGVRPVPPAPVVDKTTPVGCSDGGDLNNSLIFNRIGRCSICAMEKSVNNIGGGTVEDEDAVPVYGEKPLTGHYRASKKWTALMSTMMKACGTSDHAGSDVEQFNEMWQTFGSCSQDTYDWDTGDQFLSENDIDKIQDWGNYNYWNGDGSLPDKPGFWAKVFGKRDLPEPDKNKDFARIFGVSYATATRIFCDPERFDSPDLELYQNKKGHTKVRKKKKRTAAANTGGEVQMTRAAKRKFKKAVRACKNEHKDSNRHRRACESQARDIAQAESVGIDTTAQREPTSKRLKRMKAGQKRMKYAVNNHYIKNEAPPGVDSAAKGLESCMEEGLDRAKRNTDPDKAGAMCMKTVRLNAVELEKQMKSDLAPGNVIVDHKDCLIGHQVEKHGRNDKSTSLAFVSTEVTSDAVRRPSKGTREFYKSSRPLIADPNMARKSLTKNKEQAKLRDGLTVDYYAPFGSIYRHDEGNQDYTEMTKQVSCREYWGSPDYDPPRRSSGGTNKCIGSTII